MRLTVKPTRGPILDCDLAAIGVDVDPGLHCRRDRVQPVLGVDLSVEMACVLLAACVAIAGPPMPVCALGDVGHARLLSPNKSVRTDWYTLLSRSPLASSDRGTAAAALGLDPTLKVAAAIGDSAADLEAARPLSGVAPPAQGGDGGAEQFRGFGDGKQLIVVHGGVLSLADRVAGVLTG